MYSLFNHFYSINHPESFKVCFDVCISYAFLSCCLTSHKPVYLLPVLLYPKEVEGGGEGGDGDVRQGDAVSVLRTFL